VLVGEAVCFGCTTTSPLDRRMLYAALMHFVMKIFLAAPCSGLGKARFVVRPG
jgi:hypothetical protein